MNGIVFINYRRSDAPGMAGRLFDRLEQDFAEDQLFFDVDNIPPGKDFVAYLNEQVQVCDVLLAVVGPDWQSQLDTQDYEGDAQSEDFVRIEIEAALRQGKTVIPVLVSGAEMPRKEDLPASLHPFARRNAVRLSHERFKADAAGIANALKAALAEAQEMRAAAAAEAARVRIEKERKEKAEREAKEQAEKDASRHGAAAGLSPDQIAKAEELVNWDFIKERADPREFRDHLARFPNGVCSRMASEKLEAVLWSDLGGAPTIEALNSFLEEFPKGAHGAEARARLKELRKERAAKERERKELAAWEAVKDAKDAEKLAGFLRDWPDSQYKDEAQRLGQRLNLEELRKAKERAAKERERKELAAWEAVKNETDPDKLKAFLEKWPDSPRRTDALRLMRGVADKRGVAERVISYLFPLVVLLVEFSLFIFPPSASAFLVVFLISLTLAAVLFYRARGYLTSVEIFSIWLGCSIALTAFVALPLSAPLLLPLLISLALGMALVVCHPTVIYASGAVLGVIWLGCTSVLAFVSYSVLSVTAEENRSGATDHVFSEDLLTGALISLVVIVGSAIALAFRRRHVLSSAEVGFYWVGCSIALVVPFASGYYQSKAVAFVLLSISIVSGIALLIWRRPINLTE